MIASQVLHLPLLLVVAVVGSVAAPSASSAAVRICGAQLQSDVVSAPTEFEAKKGALAQWREKAAKLGTGYDGWHIAAEKVLKCFPKNGAFECVAVGNPCVIQQNPNQRPAGQDRKVQPL